jgi:hypothetical protein
MSFFSNETVYFKCSREEEKMKEGMEEALRDHLKGKKIRFLSNERGFGFLS